MMRLEGGNVIAAVIVSYHPNQARLAENIKTLQAQVNVVIVVDNASPIQTQQWLAQWQQPGLHVLQSPTNRGIAQAQNEGISLAIRLGAAFVLFLDQDSRPAGDMVSRLHRGYLELSARGEKVAALCPSYSDPTSRHQSSFLRVGRWRVRRIGCPSAPREYLSVDVTIASGMFMSVRVLEDVGMMDAGLFIDHVDTEWCFRARSKGYRFYVDCSATLSHSLGEAGRRIWFGRWRRIPAHSPIRHYYRIRNSMLLARRAYVPVAWVAHEAVGRILAAAIVLVAGPSRLRTLAMIARGFKDGLVQRHGPYPRDLPQPIANAEG
jgi:rhamnosyltransferase